MSKVVWIIDDDPAQNDVNRKLLENAGYTVEQFSNPSAMLPSVAKVRGGGQKVPDLIISDMDFSQSLPTGKDYFLHHKDNAVEFSGVDVINIVKKQEKWSTSIILLTGDSTATGYCFPDVSVVLKGSQKDIRLADTANKTLSAPRRLV